MDDTRTKPSPAEQVVGAFRYRGIAAVTYHRLTFALDGQFTLDDWRDLGGRWDEIMRGEYVVEGDVVRLASRKSPRRSAVDVSPLGIRKLDRNIVLVPQRYLPEFDKTNGAGDARRIELGQTFACGFCLFKKDPLPRAVVCGDPSVYGHALTRGKHYLVVEERGGRAGLRVRADHGRLRWFPATCFAPAAELLTT